MSLDGLTDRNLVNYFLICYFIIVLKFKNKLVLIKVHRMFYLSSLKVLGKLYYEGLYFGVSSELAILE